MTKGKSTRSVIFLLPHLCLPTHIYPHAKLAPSRVCFGWKSSSFNLSMTLANQSFHVSRRSIFPYFSLISCLILDHMVSILDVSNLFIFLTDQSFHVSILGHMVSILGVSNLSILLADYSFHFFTDFHVSILGHIINPGRIGFM